MKIAITGHRPDDFLVSHYSIDSIINIVNDTIGSLKRQHEELVFNLGGAVGIDQWFGRACIEQGVKFYLYLPFKPEIQGKFWSDSQKKELEEQIKHASGVSILDTSGNYKSWVYQERNKSMVDNASFLVAFWVGKKRGGTFNCMKYALQQSKFVYNALNNLQPVFIEDLKKGWTPLVNQ